MSYLEKKYACSGICNSALFYFNLQLEIGIPSKTCLAAIKKELGGQLEYYALACLTTGVLLLCVWII